MHLKLPKLVRDFSSLSFRTLPSRLLMWVITGNEIGGRRGLTCLQMVPIREGQGIWLDTRIECVRVLRRLRTLGEQVDALLSPRLQQ